jgi:hypothetical protein
MVTQTRTVILGIQIMPHPEMGIIATIGVDQLAVDRLHIRTGAEYVIRKKATHRLLGEPMYRHHHHQQQLRLHHDNRRSMVTNR